jgi:DNA recombination protein RmuC
VSPTEIGRLTQPSGADRRPAWLPVEPHNPAESYERLMQSRRSGEAESAARASHEFETGILSAAAALRQKYTGVPGIADIVVMLLPVEALYAEVLQRPALCQSLHRDYRVVVASPATLEGLLADSRSRNQTQRV